MIQIIPNWHPIFVHFTIGLLGLSVLLFFVSLFVDDSSRLGGFVTTMAKGCLWFGTLFAIATAIAGWFAFNSVRHDTPSHAAMSIHRNWALATLTVFLVLAVWSIIRERRGNTGNRIVFVLAMLIAGGLLARTGWLGGEAVYRYGLGVMSMPKVEEGADGHAHGQGGHAARPVDQKPSTRSGAHDEGGHAH